MARPKLEQDRRIQILNALETIVLRDGLANLTLAKVAQEAGLPRPLVRYFAGNRDDLILLLFDRVLERGERLLENAISAHSGALTLAGMVDLLVDDLMGDETLGRLVDELWPYGVADARVRDRLHGLYQRICDELLLRMGSEWDGISPSDRFDRAFGAVALTFGAAHFVDIGFGPQNPDAVRDLAKHLLRVGSI